MYNQKAQGTGLITFQTAQTISMYVCDETSNVNRYVYVRSTKVRLTQSMVYSWVHNYGNGPAQILENICHAYEWSFLLPHKFVLHENTSMLLWNENHKQNTWIISAKNSFILC